MQTKVKNRIALSTIFFLSGVIITTFTSRIPTIKETFALNEAELGTLLLVLPISSLIGLPVSGWLVEKYEPRFPMLFGGILISVTIALSAFMPSVFWLGVFLFLFAFFNRIVNIAMNTQAITLQDRFGKKINGSFHGLWSVGGIVGVGSSTLMVSFGASMETHFSVVCGLILIAFILIFFWLMKGDHVTKKSKIRLGKPDMQVLMLGALVFLAAISEGGMFDWSGIYFKDVIKVEVFTIGYLTFMIAMALSRFATDWLIDRLGMQKLYIISALTTVSGYSLSVFIPSFWPAMIGFCLVGMGTASIIPMTFNLAGNLKKFSPGIAISLIGTYGMVGVLAGPPIIGYIAHWLDLKASFLCIAAAALMIVPISQLFFKRQ